MTVWKPKGGKKVCFWLFLLLFCPATLLPFQWFVPSFLLQFSGLLLSFCIFLPRSVRAFSSCMFSCLGFCAFSCLSLHFHYFLCMCVFPLVKALCKTIEFQHLTFTLCLHPDHSVPCIKWVTSTERMHKFKVRDSQFVSLGHHYCMGQD